MNEIIQTIQKIFDTTIDYKTDDDTVACLSNQVIKFIVLAPYEGSDMKWALRISTKAAFDRWSNSTAIYEKFNTFYGVLEYIENNHIEILNTLLSYLTEEYRDLEEVMMQNGR